MPATTGVIKEASIAVPNASLGGLSAGEAFIGQIRRVGSDPADASLSLQPSGPAGVVLLLGISITDT